MRKTIYLDSDAAAVIGRTDNVSGRVQEILRRYRHILEEEQPELTFHDWHAACFVLRPTVFDKVEGLPHVLPQLLPAGLQERVAAMSLAARCSVIETARRYWEAWETMPGKEPYDLLRQVGAKIREEE